MDPYDIDCRVAELTRRAKFALARRTARKAIELHTSDTTITQGATMTAKGTQPEDSPTNLYGEPAPMNFIVTRHYHTGPFADMIIQSPTRVDFRPFIGKEIEAIYTKDRYTVVMVEEVTA